VMSLRPKMHLLEKAGWMLVIASLLSVEIRTILADRRNADSQALSARQLQDENFKAVLEGERRAIATTLGGFKAEEAKNRTLLEHEARNYRVASQSLSQITGGDTFAVLIPDVLTGGGTIPLTIRSRGPNVLTGVSITIMQNGILIRATQDEVLNAVNSRLQVGTLHPWESTMISRQIVFPESQPVGETPSLYVLIAAQNFTCEEFLQLRKVGLNSSGTSSWEYKYKIYRTPPYRPENPSLAVNMQLLEQTEWTAMLDPLMKTLKGAHATKAP
jgi:hypothetical protein